MSKEDNLVEKLTDDWIEQWLLKRLGKGNRFNRQFCKDLLADATPIILKAVSHQRNLLATSLLNVLRKAGILNSEAEPNGAELVMVAEMIQYADSSENPVLIPNTLRADYLKAAEQIISTAQKRIVREKNEEINKREIYWRDAVDKAIEETKKAVAEEIKKELEKLNLNGCLNDLFIRIYTEKWQNCWEGWIG